ncbi:hypothetical protein DK842_22685 [Chromobacterium phragmitis]|uniref:Uncharacterized protein n=1 Tax=Chromobacterium phragmitis TaxID=2202141 RepID=A0ABV0IN21_9NEIS|nr:hypothetical protein [Chromobacterium phragmitis]AXE32474.1 hypothetical protein DK842_22685 [Chromobacterium phragmitis]
MKKIQTSLTEITQKTMSLANLIDEAVKSGMLTQEKANSLARGMLARNHLTHSLETMTSWSSKDFNDPALTEEFMELAISIRDFLAWVDKTTQNLLHVMEKATTE